MSAHEKSPAGIIFILDFFGWGENKIIYALAGITRMIRCFLSAGVCCGGWVTYVVAVGSNALLYLNP